MRNIFTQIGSTFALMLIFFLMANVSGLHQAFGQDRTVSGIVISGEDGLPIPGVSIIVTGTTTGTVTDLEGKFQLTVPENATLSFSSVGYKTQLIQVGNRSVINLTLEPDISQLEEVVVIGYGNRLSYLQTISFSFVTSKKVPLEPSQTSVLQFDRR